MEYSKKINDLCRIYGLTPEQVFYCMLLTEGASRPEAYNIIFKPRTPVKSTNATVLKHLAKNPGITELCKYLTDIHYITPVNQDPQNTPPPSKEDENQDFNGQYRDKNSVLNGLVACLPQLKGKEKADVLMKIADLQQMKKDETTEDEEQIIYYLPLRCCKCSLYINATAAEGSKS